MNYTRPNDENHEDKPADWLAGALIFARALSLILKPNEGIVVKPLGDAASYFKENELLLVCSNGTQIQILPIDDQVTSQIPEQLKEGDFIMIDTEVKQDEDSE